MNWFYNLRQNEFGFSMIETIIAAGIGVLLVLVLSSMVTMQKIATNSNLQSYEVTFLNHEIHEFLKDTSTCRKNFSGLDPNAASPPILAIRNPSDAVIYNTTDLYSNNAIKIKNVVFGDATATVPATGEGETNLSITYQRDGSFIGSSEAKRTFYVYVRTSGGLVTDCSTQSFIVGADPKLERVDRISCTAPRNGACQNFTDASLGYDFCSLSEVRSGGDEGGGQDECRVDRISDGRWRVSARRGDDPPIVCAASCIDFDGVVQAVAPVPTPEPIGDSSWDPCSGSGWTCYTP